MIGENVSVALAGGMCHDRESQKNRDSKKNNTLRIGVASSLAYFFLLNNNGIDFRGKTCYTVTKNVVRVQRYILSR